MPRSWTFLLVFSLLSRCAASRVESAPGSEQTKGRSAADPDVLKLVQYVLKTQTGELAPETIPPFMEVDPKTVPADLRPKFQAKVEELLALQKIAGGKKKAPLRRIGNDEKAKCSREDATDAQVKVMKMAGFGQLEEHEVLELMNKTNCSECELQEEFTLRSLALPPKKKGDGPRAAYMLHESDPIWTVVATIRQGQSQSGTNFFGIGGHPKCR